jgi:thioredoxin reductase (NADPH)
MFLSRFASQVTMLVRGDSLQKSMSKYLIDQIDGTDNISVKVNADLVAVAGTDHLETITIKDCANGATETVPADAVFVFIGAMPHTDIVAGVVERDEDGFILTGQDLIREGRRPRNWKPRRDPFLMETSVPGIFAAGDVRHGVIRRVASAVGQGAVAVSLVHKYLETV